MLNERVAREIELLRHAKVGILEVSGIPDKQGPVFGGMVQVRLLEAIRVL
jgi:hypothetical protein